MRLARKKFYFHILPSDRQLWAIGMVVVQWSQLEMLLAVVAYALVAGDPVARKRYDETRSFGIRLDLLQGLVNEQVKQPHCDQIIALIVRIRNLQLLRDRVVHGAWTGEAVGPLETQTANAVFNFIKPRQSFEWKLDYAGIMKTAHAIDDLCRDLINLSFLGADPTQPITLGSALQRMRHKPGPTS